jgi:protein-S-isoprenylcysteine O-methyltransferase Ste14
MQQKKAEITWYKNLKLSEKYKLNAISGALLATLGVLTISISGDAMTYSLPEAVFSVFGVLFFLTGLWLFSVGIRYQAQLDAIRIVRRNKMNRKQAPKKIKKE